MLATLDDRDLSARRGVVAGQQEALLRNTEGARAALAKAQAELELARSKQRRDVELLTQGFVSQAVVDASNAALDAAAAGVDAARATLAAREADAHTLAQEARYADAVLSYTRIVAPMDGVVVQRLAEVGQHGGAGHAAAEAGRPGARCGWPRAWTNRWSAACSPARRRASGCAAARCCPARWRASPASPTRRRASSTCMSPSTRCRSALSSTRRPRSRIDVGEDRGIVVPLAALRATAAGARACW